MGPSQREHEPAGAGAMAAGFASPEAQIRHGGLALVVIVPAATSGPALGSAVA